MKTQNLLGTLLFFFFTFAFVSCSNDDESDGTVDFSQLKGQWAVTVPASNFDAVERYVFDTKNQTCEAGVYGPAVNGVICHYVYTVDKKSKQITLTDKEYGRTEKYEILVLSNKNMKWKNLMLASQATDKQLVKEK